MYNGLNIVENKFLYSTIYCLISSGYINCLKQQAVQTRMLAKEISIGRTFLPRGKSRVRAGLNFYYTLQVTRKRNESIDQR